MNIFYINVIENNAGWGAEYFVNQGFLDSGHETQTLDYRKFRESLASKFLEISDFDVFLLQRGEGFPLELIEACQRPRFFWASELVSRCRDQDRLFQCGLFDHAFVRTPQCISQILSKGWMPREKLSVMLSGYDALVHRKIDCKKDLDVVFVGAILPRRKMILDRLQQKFPVAVITAFGNEMADVFNRAKIVLNLHAENQLDTETRVYEALGCGAFVMTERLSEESPFVSGQHLVEVENIDDLEKKLVYYLANEQERRQIACQGHQEVAGHSYHARAEQLASVMERFLPVPPPVPLALDKTAVELYARKKCPGARSVSLGSFLSGVPGKIRKMVLR